jgi:hypothetical protein
VTFQQLAFPLGEFLDDLSLPSVTADEALRILADLRAAWASPEAGVVLTRLTAALDEARPRLAERITHVAWDRQDGRTLTHHLLAWWRMTAEGVNRLKGSGAFPRAEDARALYHSILLTRGLDRAWLHPLALPLAALWAELAFAHISEEIGTRLTTTVDGQALLLELDRRFGYTHHDWSEANLQQLLARFAPAHLDAKRRTPLEPGAVVLTVAAVLGGDVLEVLPAVLDGAARVQQKVTTEVATSERRERHRARLRVKFVEKVKAELFPDPVPDPADVLAWFVKAHPHHREGIESALSRLDREGRAAAADVTPKTVTNRTKRAGRAFHAWLDGRAVAGSIPARSTKKRPAL